MVHIKMSFRDETKAKILIQKLPFNNKLIEKTKIRGSKNIDLLHELTSYAEINIMQISKAFERYAIGYKNQMTQSSFRSIRS